MAAQNITLAVCLNLITDEISISNYFISSAIVTMIISSMYISLNYWSEIVETKRYLILQIVKSLLSFSGVIIIFLVSIFYFYIYNNPSIDILKWFLIIMLSEILSVKDRFNTRYGLINFPWHSLIFKISILISFFFFNLNYTMIISSLIFLMFIFFERNSSGISILSERNTLSSKSVGSLNSVQALILNGELELSSTANVFIDNILFKLIGVITIGVKTIFETKILENKKFLLRHWLFLSPILITLMLNKSLGLTLAVIGLINLLGKSDFLKNYINNDLKQIHRSTWLFALVFIISSGLNLSPFVSYLNSTISTYLFALHITLKNKANSDYSNLIIGLILNSLLYAKIFINWS